MNIDKYNLLKKDIMKRKFSLLMIVSLLLVFGGTTTYAQTKEEQEKKKQEMLMKEKMAEQERKLVEEQERIKIHKEELERAVEGAREAYKGVRAVREPFMITTGSDVKGVYFMGGSQSSSSLQFSKKVREASFTKDLTFEIEEDARRASISVGGMCEEGEIRIWIAMPDNKPYTEVLIDEYGSVNWSKSFDIEEENGSKTGKWGFRITAKNATGNFRLSIQSH